MRENIGQLLKPGNYTKQDIRGTKPVVRPVCRAVHCIYVHAFELNGFDFVSSS